MPFYICRLEATGGLILAPVTITTARVFAIATDDTDDVLLAELNNYRLGGVYISLVI